MKASLTLSVIFFFLLSVSLFSFAKQPGKENHNNQPELEQKTAPAAPATTSPPIDSSYTSVMAISNIANTVIKEQESRFNIILLGLGFIAAIITYLGYKQYDTIKKIATEEAKKATTQVSVELSKMENALVNIKQTEEGVRLTEKGVRSTEEGLKLTIASLAKLHIANMYLHSDNPSSANLRKTQSLLEEIIDKPLSSFETNLIIITWAYTLYSYVLNRTPNCGKAGALEFLEDKFSKGIESGGMYYNAACYVENDKKKASKYLRKAISIDPHLLPEARDDDDLKDLTEECYPSNNNKKTTNSQTTQNQTPES